eukprot:jgi/Mesen1/4212/ME000219S03338
MARKELSGWVKQMKFMQRGKAQEEAVVKSALEEKAAEQQNDEHWVAAASDPTLASKRCVVIVEGDPRPGASSGRMVFGRPDPPSKGGKGGEGAGKGAHDGAPSTSGRTFNAQRIGRGAHQTGTKHDFAEGGEAQGEEEEGEGDAASWPSGGLPERQKNKNKKKEKRGGSHGGGLPGSSPKRRRSSGDELSAGELESGEAKRPRTQAKAKAKAEFLVPAEEGSSVPTNLNRRSGEKSLLSNPAKDASRKDWRGLRPAGK